MSNGYYQSTGNSSIINPWFKKLIYKNSIDYYSLTKELI